MKRTFMALFGMFLAFVMGSACAATNVLGIAEPNCAAGARNLATVCQAWVDTLRAVNNVASQPAGGSRPGINPQQITQSCMNFQQQVQHQAPQAASDYCKKFTNDVARLTAAPAQATRPVQGSAPMLRDNAGAMPMRNAEVAQIAPSAPVRPQGNAVAPQPTPPQATPTQVTPAPPQRGFLPAPIQATANPPVQISPPPTTPPAQTSQAAPTQRGFLPTPLAVAPMALAANNKGTAETPAKPAVAGSGQSASSPQGPQKFEISGKNSSFSMAFPVTQPGAVSVDVQWSGGSLQVSVSPPVSKAISQNGNGSLHLAAQASAADIQRSSLWRIEAKATPGQKISGSISVNTPPVDKGRVDAEVKTIAAQQQAQAAQQKAVVARQMEGKIQAKLDQHKLQIQRFKEQETQSAKLAVDRNRLKLVAAPTATTSARTVQAAKPSPVGSLSTGTTFSLPLADSGQIQVGGVLPSHPPPAPRITQLNVPRAQPGTLIILSGEHLASLGGDSSSQVLFTLGPNRVFEGPVLGWSDTMIVTQVPGVSGLVEYDGSIGVVVNRQTSSVPFHFIPTEEIRAIRKMSHWENQLISGDIHTVYTDWGVYGYASIRHGDGSNFGPVFGTDVMFPDDYLKNGWVIDWVDAQCWSGGLSLRDLHLGSNRLYMQVDWVMLNSFTEVDYDFAIFIRGPLGVPDGVFMP